MSHRSLLSFAFALVTACGSSATRRPDADAPGGDSPAPAPLAASPGEAGLKPLSHYLASAVSLRVYRFSPGHGRELLDTLAEGATKAYLAKLDLAQKADGGLVKCPPDTQYELSDARGEKLGTIGFCEDVARFDGPDGKFGGIKASRL